MDPAVHELRGSGSDRKFCPTLSQDDFSLTSRDFRPIYFFPGNHALFPKGLMHRTIVMSLSRSMVAVMFLLSLAKEGNKQCHHLLVNKEVLPQSVP